jgi:hypothetical protein
VINLFAQETVVPRSDVCSTAHSKLLLVLPDNSPRGVSALRTYNHTLFLDTLGVSSKEAESGGSKWLMSTPVYPIIQAWNL